MNGLTSGKLFQRVQFLAPVMTPDFAGGTHATYTPVLSTRAQVVPMTGRRTLENGQREQIKTLQFNIRWRKDINIISSMLMIYRGLPFTIYSIVDTDDRRLEFSILAVAKEGINSVHLTGGGIMEFKNNFKTTFG